MSVDLELFCDPTRREPGGRDLSVPFSLNGHTYATNGHIIVRVAQRPAVPENKEAPNIEKLERLPWDFSRVKFGPLPECGPLDDKCLACAGTGHEHRCPDCRCECKFCDGSGKRRPIVRIGKVAFNGQYVEWMRALPGLEIGKPRRSRPLPFRFEGGEGLLMPRRD
jgi:hypothetical protein